MKKSAFTVLGAWDFDAEKGVISYLTPVGQALLGRKVGEEVEAEVGQWRDRLHLRLVDASLRRQGEGDEGVGVAGGAQDHVAILCARDQHCGLFGYLPARVHRYIPWPRDYLFVIAVSGVEATKTGNARDLYNRTSNSLRALLAAWNTTSGSTHHSLQAALDASAHAEPALR